MLGGWAPLGGGYGYPVQPQGGSHTEVKYLRETFEKKTCEFLAWIKKRKEKTRVGLLEGEWAGLPWGGPGYLAQPGGRAY